MCPHCGAPVTPTQENSAADTSAKLDYPRHEHKLLKRLLTIFVALLGLIVVLGSATYAGLYFGERDRVDRRAQIVETHYANGIQALNAGQHELAVAEFQYVLQIDAVHSLAQVGIEQARERLAVEPTPTSEAAQSMAELLLEQSRAAYKDEDWTATANSLTQLRALDPNYEQDEVEEMLFTSLYNAGSAWLEQDNLEAGISYLDQAIALRPLDAEAVNQRNLAARYLEALNYWGVDWELCIERFESLYASTPYYKDVAQRLYRAYVEHADYFTAQGDMCPAEVNYTQALRLYVDADIDQKRAEAAQVCLVATPAPLSGQDPMLTPQPVQGFSGGRLAYPVYNEESGGYDLYALYADGRILQISANADQPWWETSTGRVAYRDRIAGGLKMMLPEEGIPLQLLAPANQAWPSLSPDSQRIAYAAPDVDGSWYVYITRVNSEEEPQRLASGWAPTWGPTGLLAYTGCDAEGVCGIVIDNPDDNTPGTRLTANENDTAVSWAPAGNLMAYMSNVTGNWDIFLLNPDGGIQALSQEGSDEGLPVWSPDGGYIAFVSNREGNWAIYVTTLDRQNTWRILDLGSSFPGWDNQRLSWSP